jgi:GCN5-related N-acetyltransferase
MTVLLTTRVNRAYRNRRVATELVARLLDEIRESGKKITIICPVVGEFIARNPKYLHLIDKVSSQCRRLPAARTRGGPARRAAHWVQARHDIAVQRSDMVRLGQRSGWSAVDGHRQRRALDDVVAAFDPTDRAKGKTTIWFVHKDADNGDPCYVVTG